MILLLGLYLEAPQRRLRERIMDRAAFVRVVAHRAVLKIFLEEQHFRAAAFKTHDARRSQLPAVQPDVVRTDPRRKPALVEKFASPLVDFQPQLPLLGI